MELQKDVPDARGSKHPDLCHITMNAGVKNVVKD